MTDKTEAGQIQLIPPTPPVRMVRPVFPQHCTAYWAKHASVPRTMVTDHEAIQDYLFYQSVDYQDEDGAYCIQSRICYFCGQLFSFVQGVK